ncbi:MAG TPA: hypothetical protein VIK18_10530 [Pirellulales bacterium]
MQAWARGLIFCLSAAAAIAVCHWTVGRAALSRFSNRRPPVALDQTRFLSHYGNYGLDFLVFRFGLLGTAERLRQADVICVGSSKSLFGMHAAYLSQRLSRPGLPVRVYNAGLGFGEGFGYSMEIVKALDLRDKVLLADLTDNTTSFDLTAMGREAMSVPSKTEAYKILVERTLSCWRDSLLTGLLPRVKFDPARGFFAASQSLHTSMDRSRESGDLVDTDGLPALERPDPKYPRAAHYSFGFRYSEFEQPFFEECRRRNIRIVFMSIPYDGYDPQWGAQVAEKLGALHVAVAADGIKLWDGVHMCTSGRQLFNERLAERLLSPEIDISRCIAEVRSRRQDRAEFDLARRETSAPPDAPAATRPVRPVPFEEPIGNARPRQNPSPAGR